MIYFYLQIWLLCSKKSCLSHGQQLNLKHLATHLSLSSFSFSLKIKGNEWDFFTKFTHGHLFFQYSWLSQFHVRISEVKWLCHHIFSHVWKRSPAYMMQTCVKCSTGVPTYSLLRDCVAMNFILNFTFCETPGKNILRLWCAVRRDNGA